MSPFRIEGIFCFAKVPPGFEIRYELYDLYPDGSKNMLVSIRPMPPTEVAYEDCKNPECPVGGKEMNDYDRFELALSQITGKRLTYEHLTGKDRAADTEPAPNVI